MLKLYKRVADGILYWEAWEDSGKITTHWGRLGEIGETKEIRVAANENAERVIQRECKPQLADGFDQMEPSAALVIQYKIDGWGSPGDLETRYLIENLMNECLGWTGNGHCDGGDIGSGSINIYSFVIDATLAAATAKAALEEAKFLEGAVIASRQNFEDDEEEYRIHYPPDFRGQFSPI